jgi:CHAD domain-containing protein
MEPAVVERRATAQQVGTRLHDYADAELARALACLAWRGPRVHTGVHQARKSLRRARATLALGGDSLGPGAHLINRELRGINTGLSKLRDAHALVIALAPLMAAHADDAAALVLLRRAHRAAAHARAERARKELAEDPGLQNRRALLATLRAALHALPWIGLDVARADAAVLHSRVAAELAGEKARASNDAEDWHRWRRRARRLSQQHRALGDDSFEKREKRLAVLLGEAQDYSLLLENCGRKSPFAATDRARLRELAERGLARMRERVARKSIEAEAGTVTPA